MTEIATLIAICVIDWGYAIRAMAYTTTTVPTRYKMTYLGEGCMTIGPEEVTQAVQVPPRWHPWYQKTHFGFDRFHLVGWPRYIALGWFAWMGFGDPFAGFPDEVSLAARYYAWTATIDALGWLALKKVHGKLGHWGWKPAWLRRIWP